MKDRILQLLDLEHLTPSKFADLIGVQRSSVSHILSERNKPSFDFLQKTLKTFPGLRADWLMLGEGPMYEHMGRDSQESPVETLQSPVDVKAVNEAVDMQLPFGSDNVNVKSDTPTKNTLTDSPGQPDTEAENISPSRKIVQVMLFYDDDTFMSFKPSQ